MDKKIINILKNKALMVGLFTLFIFLIVAFLLPLLEFYWQVILAGFLLVMMGFVIILRSFYDNDLFLIGSSANLFVALSVEEDKFKLKILKIFQGLIGLLTVVLGLLIIFSVNMMI